MDSYLAVYDYGMGGIWLYVLASSPDEIRRAFPELEIIDEVPSWMSGERQEQLLRTAENIEHPGLKLSGILSDREEQNG